jgi:hypothetical protein
MDIHIVLIKEDVSQVLHSANPKDVLCKFVSDGKIN